MITLRYCRATVVTQFTQVAVSEIDFTNARQSVHFKGHPVALPAPARTALTDLTDGPEQPTHERNPHMHDAHNGPCDYPNGPCPTTSVPPGLTAMIDQAYEGTKGEAAEMVALVRRQISEGLSRESIITAHMMYLTMRYTATELATLIALLTFEQAKVEA